MVPKPTAISQSDHELNQAYHRFIIQQWISDYFIAARVLLMLQNRDVAIRDLWGRGGVHT